MDTVFTPWSSLQGGLLIGLAAVMLMAGLGRVLGATGILSGLVFAPSRGEAGWRLGLVIGMVAAPEILWALTGRLPRIEVPAGPGMIVAGGILVGFGASLGSGCTSGHGVCGLARLSRRSMVAVPVFMATAAATVFVIRHVIGG